MKKSLLLLTLAVTATLAATLAQPRRNRTGQEFMREKLALSQKILEGLALEDFEIIATRATKLSSMSQGTDWRVMENPDYDQQSLLFRRQADALIRAAKDRNIDTATLAYVRMTMSCVDCHKFIRGKLSARNGTPLREPYL